MKYSPDGGPISVAVEGHAGEVEVRVADAGMGIPDRQRESIFERFYQADDDAGRRRFGGLGLGLYISRAIIDAHGGRIWSAPNVEAERGSIFGFRIPRIATPLTPVGIAPTGEPRRSWSVTGTTDARPSRPDRGPPWAGAGRRDRRGAAPRGACSHGGERRGRPHGADGVDGRSGPPAPRPLLTTTRRLDRSSWSRRRTRAPTVPRGTRSRMPWRALAPVLDGSPTGAGGRIARYALGADYPAALRSRLEALAADLCEHGLPAGELAYVDDRPLAERALAARAGLGWIGKNSNLLTHARAGSWVFLGAILSSAELPADGPVRTNCGSCTRCLAGCPTGAIVAPHTIDARRCISYLTIEHPGEFGPWEAEAIGDWIFGCDVCREVCPVNADADDSGPLLVLLLPLIDCCCRSAVAPSIAR